MRSDWKERPATLCNRGKSFSNAANKRREQEKTLRESNKRTYRYREKEKRTKLDRGENKPVRLPKEQHVATMSPRCDKGKKRTGSWGQEKSASEKLS